MAKKMQLPIESRYMQVIEISEMLGGSKIENWSILAQAVLELFLIVKYVKCRPVI